VVPLALQGLGALEVRDVAGVQASGGGDDEARGHLLAPVGPNVPQRGGLVETQPGDRRLELNLVPDAEPIGDVVGVDVIVMRPAPRLSASGYPSAGYARLSAARRSFTMRAEIAVPAPAPDDPWKVPG
jgi:hypothetical protein